MSILIVILVVLVILALACWAVQQLPLTSPFNQIIQAVLCIIAIVFICNRMGWL